MKETPYVSVCIPTYDAAEFLEPCLLSAVNQTYSNYEILICDDGSTDDTISIIKKFQQQYPNIRLVQNELNQGMVNNWNRCIEQAKGEWIKFLFQDDVLAPNCIQEMLAACNHHNVQVSLCRRDFILHDNISQHTKRDFSTGGIAKAEEVFGDATFITPEKLAVAVKEHLRENFLGEPTCYFFSKQLLKQTTPFNPELKQLVDYEFIVRLGLMQGLAFVPQTLAYFRVHGKSQSSANTTTNKAALLRTIAADSGDSMRLLYLFLHHPAFALIKKEVGKEVLQNYLKHLYYSACKHKGKKLVNEALKPLLEKYPELNFEYNFFKYAYYRRLIKRWEKSVKS